jgi:hypothetical protein
MEHCFFLSAALRCYILILKFFILQGYAITVGPGATEVHGRAVKSIKTVHC